MMDIQLKFYIAADSLRNISTRFQVGFGTYVDKVTVPYVSRIQQVGK